MSIPEEIKMINCETLDQLKLLEELPKQDWVVLPAYFSENELRDLKTEALRRWTEGHFQPAKVGRSQDQQIAHQIRNDWTSWVNLKDPIFSALFAKVTALTEHFNRNFFLGIREFECHFARYGEGQYYAEHIDQSPSSSPLHGERVVSFVLYLNENWRPGDGGELSLRLNNQETRIEPQWGHLALFLSDTVPHAVLPALKDRWSLTGWFRRS